MARKDNNNNSIKYAAIPAAIAAAAGIALFIKKAPKAGIEKGTGIKGVIEGYKAGFRARRENIIEISAEPEEYDAEEIKEYISEKICLKEITEQDWMVGGVKLLFTAIEANYNDMLKKNDITVSDPVWHGYVAVAEGEGEYILKAAKDSAEDIYMFWEEETGFIFALHEGLDYLMQLKCGMSADEFENQSIKYMNYMGLLEVLINKFNVDLDEEMDIVSVLEDYVLEKYYEKNEK